MALNLGELSIALELENDKFRAGLAGTKRELEAIPPVARREMVKVSRVMDEEGRKSGGLLARGINNGLMRNSPLIVAGIGAALAAGAPVMTAAAGTLFAGIGAAAAAQTLEVRAAWTELGRDVRDGAVADAAVLVPVYVEMADQIGAAFQRMRPQLREAFADSAPLIRSFTDGVIALGENAMPGLVRAVSGGLPVFEGLESFLASTGQGLGDFFDAINAHGPAAGSVFASLGDIMGDLLPILGELMGQGAELASAVLPLIATATGAVLDVLQTLGPLLPTVVAGFAAFKAASAASGYLSTFSTKLETAATNVGKFGWQGEVAGIGVRKASGAISVLGRALPGIGIAVGVVSAAMEMGEARIGGWTQALMEGGKAAAQAREEMNSDSWVDGGIFATGSFEWLQQIAGWFGEGEKATASAREEYDRLVAAMSPVEQAGLRVKQAQNELNQSSGESEGASRKLAAAQAELERQQGLLEVATHGVTSAMIEQADQALAAIDSGFAYRNSVDQLEDAQAALNKAISESGAGSEEAQRAQLGLEEQAYRTALAFGQQQADLSGLSSDSLEYKQLVQQEMLVELKRLQSAAGPEMAASIGKQIAALEASGVKLATTGATAATTAQRMRDLGLTVTRIPGSKAIVISAPTEDQRRRLKELGLIAQTMPNGKIIVTADTSPAAGTLAAFMNQRRTIQIRTIISGGSSYQGMGQQPTAATGGRIRDVVHGFTGGGKLSGPGTPTSDSIPALTYSGRPLRVSDEEWVIQARSARMYGDDTMAAVNAGTARITAPGLAGGGAVGNTSSDRPLFHAETVNVIEGTPKDVAQELAYLGRTRGW